MSHPQGSQPHGYAYSSASPPGSWQYHDRDPEDTYRPSYEWYGTFSAHAAHAPYEGYEAYGAHSAHGGRDPRAGYGDRYGVPDVPDAPEAPGTYGAWDAHGVYRVWEAPGGGHVPHEPYPFAPHGGAPRTPPAEPLGRFGPPEPAVPAAPAEPVAPAVPPEPHTPYAPPEPAAPLAAHPPPDSSDPLFPPASSVPSPLIPRQSDGGRAAARRAARARETAPCPQALRRLVPQALVVAFLAGGTSAFVASDKAVELTVEGRPRTLHTFADDVAELLAEEGVRVGRHDAVSPAPGEPLAHGDRVTVRFGRPLVLTLDGRRQRVWTTAPTVAEALRRLGVRPEGAYLSVPRDRRIGRDGLTLTVRTERSVTFVADGREHTVRTNAATVRRALAEAGITLRGQDTASVALDSFPRDGQTITVLRITDTERVSEEPIAFTTVRREDPTLPKGTEVVTQAGRPGLRRITHELRTVNGVRLRPRHVETVVVREPTPRIVRVGTREVPSSVRGADHLNWDALARCESGGRPDAVDPTGTHGGLYQFDSRTWRGLGGKGRPQDASPAEQTYRAKKLYVRKGASPWPVCGRKLHE
ncbi:ubiquitin-like domain-containing protein [Streptomyces megasporus]|uniref:ubiquitin-like domain-containing protein n=1 Tax=Streptomyces megasporus TaxID=44060 RepID=UPI0004E2766A